MHWSGGAYLCARAGHCHTNRDAHNDSQWLVHSHPESNAVHPHRHGDCYADPHSHSHHYIDAHRFSHAVPASHLYIHALIHTLRYTDLYALAHGHIHAEPHVHAISSADQYVHANAHGLRYTYAKPYPFSHAMSDIIPFLKSLISASGLSAHEGPVARLIEEKWKPLVDEVSMSRLGSLHALKKGKGKSQRPSIMIATHMDAIGLIVTQIADGLIHVDEIGGIDARILPGTPVTVHGKQDLPGVVILPPMKTLPQDARDNAIGLPHLLVDVGLPPSKTATLVRVGDLVSFNTPPLELTGEFLSGHSLDNRASVAALTVCLEELQAKSHVWDVWAVATVQEEETLGGAATSAHHLNPDLAVAMDVTFAKGPGANGWETFPLGKGPTLGWGANLHPFLYKKFKELADKLEIPVAMDITPTHSGTDAYAMQVAREGIPTAVIGIPLRYMHTPVEMVAIKDIQRAGRLLAEFISGLEADFVSKISWEEKEDDK